MAITLYHAPRTRSIRPRWLMEEMGIPYTLERVDFTRGDVGGAAYKAVFALQKVPALTDGDVTLCESVAIMEYILGRYGPSPLAAQPSDPDYAHYLQWLHFGESGMGTYVTMALGHLALLPEERRVPGIAKWGLAETSKCLDFIAQGLGDKPYLLARGFSAADISVVYMLLLVKLMRQLDAAPEPVKAYWARVTERPAWKLASAD